MILDYIKYTWLYYSVKLSGIFYLLALWVAECYAVDFVLLC